MEDVLQKLKEYKKMYAVVGRGHYIASDRSATVNRALGTSVVVITAVVGSTIFATINKSLDAEWKIATGLISLLATILSSLQTYLKLSERSDLHKTAGGKYRSVMRRLDLLLLKYSKASESARQEIMAQLEAVQNELSKLAKESPNLPDKDYFAAEKEYELKQT